MKTKYCFFNIRIYLMMTVAAVSGCGQVNPGTECSEDQDCPAGMICDPMDQQCRSEDCPAGAACDVDAGPVDQGPPDTILLAQPGELSASRLAIFEFVSTKAESTFMCRVDEDSFAECSSPHQINVDDGVHTFAVYAIDTAGNHDTTPAETMWRADLMFPDTVFVSGPRELDNSEMATFEFEASEPMVTFECALDGGPPVSGCVSPHSVGPLGSGPHTLTVRAKDQAGNIEEMAAEYAWAIDLSTPDTTIDSGPSGPVNTTTAVFAFSSPTGLMFECDFDGGGWAPCTAPQVYEGLTEGCYELEVRTWNAAGTVDPTPATRTWCVDVTPPVTTMVQTPAQFSNTTVASVEFECDEPGCTFECSVDGAAAMACTSPFIMNGLSEGAHTVEVRASDAAGNAETTAVSYAWEVDITPPSTTIVGGPSNPSNATTVSFGFEGSEAGSTFECRLDSGAWEPCTSPHQVTGLSEGSHSFSVRAIDRAGNVDTAFPGVGWSVDITPPETAITSGLSGAVSSAQASFEFLGNETGSSFQCSLDGAAWAPCTSPQAYSALSEGSHTFRVRAIDSAGNIDGSPATNTWLVDTVACNATISSGPSSPVSATTGTVVFTSSEANSTFECRLDGGSWTACTPPVSYTGLGNGSHTVQVRCIDSAGNVDGTPASHTWTVDTIAPNTSISSGPSGLVSSTTASFSFTSSEAGSTFECKLDSGSWGACSSPQSYSGLGQGSHTFEVRATDAASNTDGTPATRTWTVDTVVPNTSITGGPSGAVSATTASFSFTSSEAVSTFECRLDGGSWAACTSPQPYSGLGQGSHTFEVRARDGAGNVDASPATRTWTVDTVAPNTSITGGPSGAVSATTASFSFTSSETNSTFACRLDGGSWAACTSPQPYSGLSQGAHTFEVRATDSANNTDSTPATRTWTVDTVVPDTSITGGPSGAVSATTASFSFTSSEAGAAFECSMDGGSWAACTSPQPYSGLGQGSHTFQVRARDSAGNVDASPATRTWTVDTIAPDTSITGGPSGAVSSTTASFSFTSNEAGATFQCSLDGASWAACTSPQPYSGLSQGSHTFQVRARDSAGNVDASPATRTWTVDTVAPDTAITAGMSGTVKVTTASFSFIASESGSTFQCRLDSGSWVACTSPKPYSGLSAGSHTFRVRAIDSAGNVDGTPATNTWTIDVTAPNTTITSGPSGTVTSTTASFSFTSSESGSTFQCKLDTGNWASCTSPKSYSGLSDGSHTFQVRAIDSAGNVDGSPATRTWTVDTTAPTVTITSGPFATTFDRSATFEFSASEPNSTFECRLDGGSWSPCASPTTYNTLIYGIHTFEVRATDSAGNRGPITSRTWEIELRCLPLLFGRAQCLP